jgi:hypothetical protein
MDFQDAFLTLYWPVWERMLSVFLAGSILVALIDLLIHSQSRPRPRRRSTFAGQEVDS